MTWWHYLLLVNFYLVLFFGFYALLLRRETFFQLNRVYLVAASLLSFMIPLIQADWVKDLFITREMQQTIYSGPIAIAYNFAPVAKSSVTLGEVLNVIYIAVTLFLVLRLIWQLAILKKAIEKPSPSAAYSFFKKISLGKDISQSKIIADHEQVHAGQWHSVDVMIIETVMIINWFNPVVYLYRFAIKYIHEFIADREVIQAGTDKVDYAMLLLSQTFEVPTHRLVNPFYNHSLLKKRITMLQKDRSQRIALAKYGLSAPLFILMMIFSSATVNNSKAIATIDKKTEKVLLTPASEVTTAITDHAPIPGNSIAATDTVPGGKIYASVEDVPQFPGGLEAFGKFIATNITYPAEDRTNKIKGRAVIQFVVETDGNLSDIKVLRAPTEAMGKEAVRVLLLSPVWTPGKQHGQPVRVSYTVPINFTLDDQTAAPTDKPTSAQQKDDKVFSQVEEQPQFPGGLEALGKFLAMNVRYPKADREAGKQGRVLCSFVVEEDGTLSDITAVRTPSETLAKEAVRVLLLSPKWKPGVQNGHVVRVSYTIPINFTISDDETKKKTKDTIITFTPKGATSPLYVLDGEVMKVQPGESPLATIKQEDIASMNILKDDMAVKAYGERGRNGVIEIITKNKAQKPGTIREINDLGVGAKPLIVIDGKQTDISLDLIDQKKIASMEVLKGETATKLYGAKGKNGVILIKTVKPKTTKP